MVEQEDARLDVEPRGGLVDDQDRRRAEQRSRRSCRPRAAGRDGGGEKHGTDVTQHHAGEAQRTDRGRGSQLYFFLLLLRRGRFFFGALRRASRSSLAMAVSTVSGSVPFLSEALVLPSVT